MLSEKNTFGDYKFEKWVPQHTREIIKNFWGQMGRTYKDWLDNAKADERDFCYHGPNPNGFGNPHNGVKATYYLRRGDKYEEITGRYLHRWNNMGSLIDAEGNDHTVSSCDCWIRIFMTDEEREKTLSFGLLPREKEIFKLRFGESVKTLEEVADQFEVTTERVRQIENKSLNKISKLIIAILLAVSISIPIITQAANSELDPRYLAPVSDVSMTREYFYLGKIKMPLQTILDLQWWSETKCYKKTLIVETYYSKGRITKTIKCTKLLNWWEPEKANCQAK